MKVKTHVDIAPLGHVLKQLSKITGKSFEKVVKTESAHILANALRATPKTNEKKLVKRLFPQGYHFKKYVGNRMVTNWEDGSNYHVGIPIKGKGKKGSKYVYPITKWLRRNKWQRFLAEQEKKLQKKLGRRGLAASQFYYMAQQLKLPVVKKPPKYILNPSVGKIVKPKVNSYMRGKKTKLEVIMQSKGLKISKDVQAQRILLLKTKGRITNFRTGLKKQLFNDIKWRTSRYPLLYN